MDRLFYELIIFLTLLADRQQREEGLPGTMADFVRQHYQGIIQIFDESGGWHGSEVALDGLKDAGKRYLPYHLGQIDGRKEEETSPSLRSCRAATCANSSRTRNLPHNAHLSRIVPFLEVPLL